MYNVHAILISSMHHVVDDLAFCEILIPALQLSQWVVCLVKWLGCKLKAVYFQIHVW